MAINIKKSHKGLLHKNLGVPQGQKIPASKIAAAKNSSDPAVRKRATFAQNARGWKHVLVLFVTAAVTFWLAAGAVAQQSDDITLQPGKVYYVIKHEHDTYAWPDKVWDTMTACEKDTAYGTELGNLLFGSAAAAVTRAGWRDAYIGCYKIPLPGQPV